MNTLVSHVVHLEESEITQNKCGPILGHRDWWRGPLLSSVKDEQLDLSNGNLGFWILMKRRADDPVIRFYDTCVRAVSRPLGKGTISPFRWVTQRSKVSILSNQNTLWACLWSTLKVGMALSSSERHSRSHLFCGQMGSVEEQVTVRKGWLPTRSGLKGIADDRLLFPYTSVSSQKHDLHPEALPWLHLQILPKRFVLWHKCDGHE